MDMNQSHGNSALVAKIAAQMEYANASHHGKARLEIGWMEALNGAVIDKQNIQRTRVRRNSLIKPADKFRGGSPVVAERHEDYGAHWHTGVTEGQSNVFGYAVVNVFSIEVIHFFLLNILPSGDPSFIECFPIPPAPWSCRR